MLVISLYTQQFSFPSRTRTDVSGIEAIQQFSFPSRTRTDVSGIEAIRDILRILIEKGSADVNLRQKDGLTNPILGWVFALQVLSQNVWL